MSSIRMNSLGNSNKKKGVVARYPKPRLRGRPGSRRGGVAGEGGSAEEVSHTDSLVVFVAGRVREMEDFSWKKMRSSWWMGFEAGGGNKREKGIQDFGGRDRGRSTRPGRMQQLPGARPMKSYVFKGPVRRCPGRGADGQKWRQDGSHGVAARRQLHVVTSRVGGRGCLEELGGDCRAARRVGTARRGHDGS
ncbi:hypothetical protein GGTG_00275 [Gaeumannomyces tritici R3-111a-1]|uniref:Uncharacterized protein n=1 Tax=Gaeumannomyces tritici (strain R3-111a-1) TaxID=644352 RepID=J3NG82_GAET3|nr:hypothetical protein GGTG_00275 [Gaeumannomyces tritici R3-111a-1]EJT80272.1 hypothetical protein GGTG_00275 [Gaeumannomyces tritici R3-111a-1]